MLNIDPVVQINVAVGTSTVLAGTFDVGAILTPTAGTANGTGEGAVLSVTHRFATYSSFADVANGITDGAPMFATTTDVYKAAEKYFGVSPAPAKLVVIYYDTAENTTETPVTALLDAIDGGAQFYGVYYSPKSGETAANIKTYIVSIASALNSLNRGVEFYGVSGTATDITGSDSIMKVMAQSGAKRAIGLACASETDDAAGLMGVAMGYAHTGNSFALCYKSVATAAVDNYTQSDVDKIKEINGNVYVARTKTRAGIENGATASGLRFDDVLFIDKIAYDIQMGIYNMIANSTTKLPQNDSTSTMFVSEINRILEGYFNLGVLSTATWRGTLYNDMSEDMVIEHGYYAMVDSFDNQTTADRALRKAMPITILLCLSGSVESIVINLDVQT